MLDREQRFFYNLCRNAHTWEIFGDMRADQGVIHGQTVLVFTYASLFDLMCPDPLCHERGSVRLHNPNGYAVYCFTVCKCGRGTYALMARDERLEGKLDGAMQNYRYTLKHTALVCHDCAERMKKEEYDEVVS